jgi:hypothetical protein
MKKKIVKRSAIRNEQYIDSYIIDSRIEWKSTISAISRPVVYTVNAFIPILTPSITPVTYMFGDG